MLVVIGFMAAPAAAHPLGNFTVNRYARLEVSAGHVRVHYVLDLAEIPAFQVRKELEADRRRFAKSRAEEIGRGLRLDLDGRRLDLRRVGQRLSEPPGQGGLPTLRLEVSYEAETSGLDPDAVVVATFEDTNELDRIGWREIVAVARGDAVIVEADVPSDDASDELRRYPEDLSRSPLDRRRARVLFKPGRLEVTASEGGRAAVGRVA
ncbi:MAG: nickel transporter, partial [Actinobacteria bacterium]|nr:nickel transporter [Actinomycetota bacterium]